MTSRRIQTRTFPDPPKEWDASSRAVWYRLIQILENSELFDKGRRNVPAFIVKGSISIGTTVEIASPSVTTLTHQLARLLVGLQGTPYVNVKTTLA